MHDISIFFLLYVSRILEIEYHLFVHKLWQGCLIKKKKVVAGSSLSPFSTFFEQKSYLNVSIFISFIGYLNLRI